MSNKYSTFGFDKVYVINLKRRKDRKKILIESFPTIDFTFIEAIDSNDLNQKQLLKDKILNSSFFDPHGMVSMGVFACALSHKKAWDQALSDKVENALILEDDVILQKPFNILKEDGSFTDLYQDMLDEIKNIDYDLIHLGKKSRNTMGINVGKYLTYPTPYTNYNGAHSYLVTRDMLKVLTNKVLPIKNAADTYLEHFYNTHNSFTFKESIFLQRSDVESFYLGDSDTYFNEYRKGGGKVGISFDENGNILNKNLAKYIKHPTNVNDFHEIVLSKPKFGLQKLTSKDSINYNFLGITKLISFLSLNLKTRGKMVEINSHLGENTFYFGACGLFSNIYAIDPLKGEDKFNITHNMTWDDIEIGFNNNNYFHENIKLIKSPPENISNIPSKLLFVYINNRKNKDINSLVKLYLPKLALGGYIGGDRLKDAPKNSINFEDGSWLIKKEDYEF